MKKILAIGGSVIKTAKDLLYKVVEKNGIECLIHTGGSIFHDFQLSTEKELPGHSYPLTHLLKDYNCNKNCSKLLWNWLNKRFDPQCFTYLKVNAPVGSVTRLCEDKKIPVFMFTIPGADFWHLFFKDWTSITKCAERGFDWLCNRFTAPFHYINMGSAVVHPEVFVKALAVAKPKPGTFRADVVDFLDMYRPRTRVATFGVYHLMPHTEYLQRWLDELEGREMKNE